MARRVRSFVFDNSGLRHIHKRIMEGLYMRGEALPEYAGTTQRFVEVIVEHVDRKPTQVFTARGYYRAFDQHGRLATSEPGGEPRTWQLSDDERRQIEARILRRG